MIGDPLEGEIGALALPEGEEREQRLAQGDQLPQHGLHIDLQLVGGFHFARHHGLHVAGNHQGAQADADAVPDLSVLTAAYAAMKSKL